MPTKKTTPKEASSKKAPAKTTTAKTTKPAATKTTSATKTPAAKKTTAKKAVKKQKPLELPDNAKDLTEEVLLEMPEDMYMNQLQLDFFRLKLEEMRTDILKEIAEAKERLKTPAQVGDEVDMAGLVESQQIDIRIVERKTKLLVNIEKAIARIADSDYGYCTETGEPIGIARLLVRPTAVLCITSKEIHEAKERQEEL